MGERSIEFFEMIADATLFVSAFDKAKAKAAEFAAEWQKMGAQVTVSAAQVEAATAKVGASGPKLAGGAGGLGLIGLSAAAYGLMALAAAAAGVLAITQRLVENYALFSQQILLNSEAMGMNTADLQVWEKIAAVVGIDQQQMVTGFERFAKNLNDGAPALKAAGVSLKDLRITTTDTSVAILQLSDYFHTHTDQSQKAAIAMALFGRSGAELIPILDQGSAAVSKYKDQLQAMGVILSESQLVAGARAKAALTEMTTAFDVAKSELVSAALPGFTVFFHTLSVIMQSNASLWVQVGQTIGNVVMFISGLIAGMAGVSLVDILAAPADAGNAYQGLGAGAQGAASGMDAAAQSTAAATAAIDAQIDALTTLKQSYQDQLDVLHDVTDSRRRSGEDIITYERRLQELGLQDKIKGVDRQIALLNEQKASVKSAAGTMASDLVTGMNTGMAGLNTSLATGMTKAELKILEKAHQMGQDIIDVFAGNTSKADAAAARLGGELGAALWGGFTQEISNEWSGGGDYNGFWGAKISPGGPAARFINWFVSTTLPALPHSAAGGITSGPTLAGEAGTEVVLPMNNRSRSLALMEQSGMAALARSAAGGSSGGVGGGLTINVTGPIYTDEPHAVARMMTEVMRKLRQQGLPYTRGIT